MAECVNAALVDVDPSIEVISEPGRFYVESAFTLTTYVHSKKIIDQDSTQKRHYYINDGVYGSFMNELLGLTKNSPIYLNDVSQLFSRFYKQLE